MGITNCAEPIPTYGKHIRNKQLNLYKFKEDLMDAETCHHPEVSSLDCV